jgi:predicted transcriptional regulator
MNDKNRNYELFKVVKYLLTNNIIRYNLHGVSISNNICRELGVSEDALFWYLKHLLNKGVIKENKKNEFTLGKDNNYITSIILQRILDIQEEKYEILREALELLKKVKNNV